MLKVKTGVMPKNLVIAAAAINAALILGAPSDVWITSGTDGTHMKGSKHYEGNALDLRRKNMTPDVLAQYLLVLKERLGRDYDVVLERDHIHVEYDPKPAVRSRKKR